MIAYPIAATDLMVPIADPNSPNAEERAAISDNCARYGLSFYRLPDSRREAVITFWRQLGLRDAIPNPQSDQDGISHITVTGDARYIPYTNHALNWHTDGYYGNPPIRHFAMHCVRQANTGGENSYFDHRALYRLLKERAPAHVVALSRHDAMTIPENNDRGKILRKARSVPVFSFDKAGVLLMRWTERERNIIWQQDEASVAARHAVRDILRRQTHFRIDYSLKPNEGVVCDNVLHRRVAFADAPDAPRLLFRGRYAAKASLA